MAILDNRVKSLLDTVQKGLARAERDNDLIYHHDTPAVATLPPIQETSLAGPTIPPALRDPKIILNDMQPLFDGLTGWGAREAISMLFCKCVPRARSDLFPDIYNDRKQTLVQERVVDVVQELQFQADECVLNTIFVAPSWR